ncbi:hypothetical protein P4S72_01190 [Vibrio sp. PP-XX7]
MQIISKLMAWDYVAAYDGELDIKHGSDFVTVSYSVFKNHNKTMLIGHSKNNAAEDEGSLTRRTR